MIRNQKLNYGLAAFVMISFLCVSIISSTSASTATWLTASLEKVHLQYVPQSKVNQPFGCQPHTFTVYTTRWENPQGKKTLQSDCWFHNGGGGYGDVQGITYIQPVGFSSALQTNSSNGIQQVAGDRIIRKTWYGLIIYDNARDAVERSDHDGRAYLEYKTGAEAWVAKRPITNNQATVYRFGMSNNGRYIVMEQSQAFVRLDVETKEMIPFALPWLRYGVGLDPSYDMSISDDGRFVVINGGDRDSRDVVIYDLSTCGEVPPGKEVASGCISRHIKQYMAKDTKKSSVRGINFISNGDMIKYMLYEDGKWTENILKISGAEDHYLQYLALGDSYSSGEGDGDDSYYLPGTNGDGAKYETYQTNLLNYPYHLEKCHNSIRSYPYLLAKQAQLGSQSMRSVACSGAETGDIYFDLSYHDDDNRYDGHYNQFVSVDNVDVIDSVKVNSINNFALSRATQTEFVRKYRPAVVTVGIGGNDLQFSHILMDCIMDKDKTCSAATSDRKKIASNISNNVYDQLVKTFSQLKSASPTTRFYAIGYPQIFTTHSTCDFNAQLDFDERIFSMMTIQYLNDAIEVASKNLGFNYIDIEESLAETNLCSGEEYPTVNGLTAGNDIGFIGNESYHPNEKGHELIYKAIDKQIQHQAINKFDPCSVSVSICDIASQPKPAIPQYFLSGPGDSSTALLSRVIQSVNDVQYAYIDSVEGMIIKTGEIFKPNSPLSVTLHSDVVKVGDFVSDSSGRFNYNLKLPQGFPLGRHELHISGIDPAGQPFEIYEPFFALHSEKDIDGDNILNVTDKCPFVDASNQDRDRDGIDDACDSRYEESVAPGVNQPASDVTVRDKYVLSTMNYLGPIATYTTAPKTPETNNNDQSIATHEVDGISTPIISTSTQTKANDIKAINNSADIKQQTSRNSDNRIPIIVVVSMVSIGAIVYLSYRLWIKNIRPIIKS